MVTNKLNRYWTLVIVTLIIIIIIGGVIAWLRYHPGQPVEISMPSGQEWQGIIHIGGEVNNPGFYPFNARDSLEALIQAAGGISSTANPDELRLYIPTEGEEQEPQKVDINRADVWLLESLPGIGETLAQRIVDYRQRNGPFSNTDELLKISGIGTNNYEEIKHLITVAE